MSERQSPGKMPRPSGDTLIHTGAVRFNVSETYEEVSRALRDGDASSRSGEAGMMGCLSPGWAEP